LDSPKFYEVPSEDSVKHLKVGIGAQVYSIHKYGWPSPGCVVRETDGNL